METEERGKIEVFGARVHNLKNVDVEIPHDSLTVITGLSGSGKSSLINETLQPILSQKFYRSLKNPLPYDTIEDTFPMFPLTVEGMEDGMKKLLAR